jgi:AraC family transcriptional regulator, transcriptional activator of pobA
MKHRSDGTHKSAPIYKIPTFGLYGTAVEPEAAGYAHIETIATRAPATNWRISAHRHVSLAQCLVIREGAGTVELEGRASDFTAPWFIWLPASVVHGFRFEPGAIGHVLTLSDDVVSAAVRSSADAERLSEVIASPFFSPVPSVHEIGIDVVDAMEHIANEHALPRQGVNTIIASNLLVVLVALLRVRTISRLADNLGSARASDFRRFRAVVEQNFRGQKNISAIASELGITTDKLHSVTAQAVGKGPLEILHDRILLECKRELIYTDKPIAEIGFDCGFSDPAHFSRFFSIRTGCSPREYRRRRKSSAGSSAS